MWKVWCIFLALIYFEKVSSMDNERINEGASTSTELSECERCEIFGYAESMVRLMLAEDVSAGNLTDVMNNHFDELIAFHDEIFSTLVIAEHGARIDSDVTRRNKRLELYNHYIRKMILETIQKACSEHFHLKLWYEYDADRNLILIRENVSFSLSNQQNNPSGNCLCENERERNILSESFSVPEIYHPRSILQFNVHGEEISVMETVPYHIIPSTLISNFFRVWLSDEDSTYVSAIFSDCVLTLFGRIRRTLQKLLLVQMKNTLIFSNEDRLNIAVNVQSNENGTFFAEMFARAYTWLDGNIFLGPRDRGLFNPEFQKNGQELNRAFEKNAEPIIGARHYEESFELFHELMIFVLQAPMLYPFEKLLKGLQLYNSMAAVLVRYDITLLDIEQWEFREPFDEELSEVPPQLRKEMKTKKYWAIKKLPRRSSRSVNYIYEILETPKSTMFMTMTRSNRVWSEFVTDFLKISMETRSQNKLPLWSCNFTRLFNDYLFNKVKSADISCPLCASFDEYLYSKISHLREWQSCNNGTIVSKKWCQAWKRISKNLIFKIDHLNFKSGAQNKFSKMRSSSYLKDVETLIQWLSSKVDIHECQKANYNDVISARKPFQPQKISTSVFGYLLCDFEISTSAIVLKKRLSKIL